MDGKCKLQAVSKQTHAFGYKIGLINPYAILAILRLECQITVFGK
jgi:hypothetical protein